MALAEEVLSVADAVLVERGLPDFASKLLSDSLGEAAARSDLGALHAALDGLVLGWGDEHMEVSGHDDKGVEPIAVLVAIVK